MFGASRVLVIDDSMTVRRMVQLTLPDFRVTAEASGQSGLAAARREPPQLVLLADTLPDTTAAALCAASVAPNRSPARVRRVQLSRSVSHSRAALMFASQAATRSGSSSVPAESPVPK